MSKHYFQYAASFDLPVELKTYAFNTRHHWEKKAPAPLGGKNWSEQKENDNKLWQEWIENVHWSQPLAIINYLQAADAAVGAMLRLATKP